jgi:hypothetical protein
MSSANARAESAPRCRPSAENQLDGSERLTVAQSTRRRQGLDSAEFARWLACKTSGQLRKSTGGQLLATAPTPWRTSGGRCLG